MNRIAFFVTACAVFSTSIALGDFYVTVKGVKQGQFKGEGAAAASNRITCIGFDYEIKSPRDAATGQSSGKRQHGTIRIIKEWGASSPLFHKALTGNEALASVEFQFTKVDPKTGQQFMFQTITLSNATVAEIRQYISTNTDKSPALRNGAGLEEIVLTFDSGFVMNNLEGKTSSSDLTTFSATSKPEALGGLRPGRVPPPVKTK